MKKNRFIFLSSIIFLCACVTASVYAFPEGTTYDLPRYVVGSGGNSMTSANYTFNGSAGLISSDMVTSTNYRLSPEYHHIAYYPNTITTLSVEVGDAAGEIKLTWTAPGADGTVKTASAYVVKYAVYEISNQTLFDAATTFGQSWSPAAPGTTENETITALDMGTTYYICIEARNSLGNQAFLSTGPVITVRAQEDDPAGISNLTALSGSVDGELILNWTSPGDDGTVGNLTGIFRIKYSTVAIINSTDFDSPPSNYAVTTVDISTTSLAPLTACTSTFFNLEAGASYWFAIKTKDEVDKWSVWTSSADDISINTEACAEAQDLVPDPPTGLTTLAGNTQIKLTWVSAPAAPDLYSYEIWCDSTAADGYDFTESVLVGTTLQAYTTFYHTGLENDVVHFYRIRTVDKGSEDGFFGLSLKSDYTSTVSTEPYLGAPMPPTDFVGVALSTVIIEWSWMDNATTEDGFEIRTDTDGVVIDSVTLAIEIPGTGTTSWYQTAGLTANTSSFVQYIHAVSNDYGLSPPTTDAAAPVWTLANNATGCALTDVDITSITLDWSQYVNENPSYTHWGVSISTDDFSVYTSTPIGYSDNLIEATTILYTLSANCTYSLRICSYNEDEISDWYYDAGSTSTLCNIPGVPTIAETWISSMAVTIDTTDNSYWTEYSIKVTSGTDDPAEIQYVQANDNPPDTGIIYRTTATWTDNIWITGLVANTTHSISVNARNSNGITTDYTAAVTSCTHIEKATGVDFTIYVTSISVRPAGTFTNITDGNSGIISYNITASTGSGWAQNTNWWYEGPDDLTPNTTYSFESNSRNSYGIECGSTTETSTSTLCNIPGVPTVSSIYGSSITLQLDTVDNSYWTEYSIKVTSGTDETAQYLQTGSTIAAAEVIYQSTVTWGSDIWLTDLTANTSHTIYVNARNSNGIITEYSQTITTNTLTNPTTGLYIVSQTSSSVSLEWFANDNPSGTRYGLSLSSDNFVSYISTSADLSDNLTVPATAAYSLSPNTTYWFRTWTSSEAVGDISAFDGPVSTSTLCNIPGVSTVSAIYGSSMTLQLDTVDNSYWTEYSIKVTSGTDETAQYLQTGSTIAAADVIYQSTVTWGSDIWLTDLTANTSHTIYVNARNSNGIITEYSQTVTTDTLLNPTTGLYVVSRTSYSISLEWFANNNPSDTWYGVAHSTDSSFTVMVSTIADWDSNLTATTTTAYLLSPSVVSRK